MAIFTVVTQSHDVGTLVARGELDFSSGDLLAAAAATRSGWRTLNIDLRDVTFIDAGGLRCLLALRESRDVRCVNPSAVVSRLVDLTGTRTRLLGVLAASAV